MHEDGILKVFRGGWGGASRVCLSFVWDFASCICLLQLRFISHSSERQKQTEEKKTIQPETKCLSAQSQLATPLRSKEKVREVVTVGCLSRRASCPEVIRRRF